LSAALGRLHGAAQSGVQQHERRAREEVYEDDTEPEVDVEVGVHVRDDERRKVHL